MIDDTDLGILTCVIPVPKNAPIAIFSRFSGSSIEVRDEQPQKASAPIILREVGSFTYSNFSQPEKVYSSISVTPSGIIIEVIPVFPKASALMISSVSGKVTEVKLQQL